MTSAAECDGCGEVQAWRVLEAAQPLGYHGARWLVGVLAWRALEPAPWCDRLAAHVVPEPAA